MTEPEDTDEVYGSIIPSGQISFAPRILSPEEEFAQEEGQQG